MDEIEIELTEILMTLNDIKSFSIQGVKILKLSLERYDVITEQLFNLDQHLYSKSTKNIRFIERKMYILESKGAFIALKRTSFLKARQCLLRSIQDDLSKYRYSGKGTHAYLLAPPYEHHPIDRTP
jgi:hypothetical protein